MGLLRFPEMMQSGAYAEYVTAPASDLALKPASLDHVHAAALPMSGLTAWQYLIDVGHDHPSPFQDARHRPVDLNGDMTVLVNGAGGGVGHLALQLAAWKGARTVAVASGAHERFLRDLGADAYIDYTKQRPEDVVRDVDVVLDAVGGPTSRRFLPPTSNTVGRFSRCTSGSSTKRRMIGSESPSRGRRYGPTAPSWRNWPPWWTQVSSA